MINTQSSEPSANPSYFNQDLTPKRWEWRMARRKQCAKKHRRYRKKNQNSEPVWSLVSTQQPEPKRQQKQTKGSIDPRVWSTHRALSRLQTRLTSTRTWRPNGESEEWRDANNARRNTGDMAEWSWCQCQQKGLRHRGNPNKTKRQESKRQQIRCAARNRVCPLEVGCVASAHKKRFKMAGVNDEQQLENKWSSIPRYDRHAKLWAVCKPVLLQPGRNVQTVRVKNGETQTMREETQEMWKTWPVVVPIIGLESPEQSEQFKMVRDETSTKPSSGAMSAG